MSYDAWKCTPPEDPEPYPGACRYCSNGFCTKYDDVTCRWIRYECTDCSDVDEEQAAAAEE